MPSSHSGLPVPGYKPQSEEAVAAVAAMKALEERVLRAVEALPGGLDADPRWLAIGRTSLEQGFMAVNRAVFRPGRVVLPEDPEPEAEVDVTVGGG